MGKVVEGDDMHSWRAKRSVWCCWVWGAALLVTGPGWGAELEGTVSSVMDGDSIQVSSGGEEFTVNVMGIDCPELRQSFGVKAHHCAKLLLLGKDVSVHVSDSEEEGDCTTVCGDVRLADGRRVSEVMLSKGLAWHDRNNSSDAALAALEEKARAAKKGLWFLSSSIPPWEYREEHPDEVEETEPRRLLTLDPDSATVDKSTASDFSDVGVAFTQDSDKAKYYTGRMQSLQPKAAAPKIQPWVRQKQGVITVGSPVYGAGGSTGGTSAGLDRSNSRDRTTSSNSGSSSRSAGRSPSSSGASSNSSSSRPQPKPSGG